MSETASARYVMGHNERERRRLALQASILQPFTEHLFRRAGITTGMRVLDLGCGVGDVSLLAARLIGRTGSVTSVDIDTAALQIVRERAAAEGLHNISCIETDIHAFRPEQLFDAVVGRHILIHTPDPLSVLKACRNLLHPKGPRGVSGVRFSDRTAFVSSIAGARSRVQRVQRLLRGGGSREYGDPALPPLYRSGLRPSRLPR